MLLIVSVGNGLTLTRAIILQYQQSSISLLIYHANVTYELSKFILWPIRH